MPIYEYKCDLCNGLWEEIQKFSDDPLTVCKSCEKEGGVHKNVSRTTFILHGAGWYKDGYSSKKDEPKQEHVFEATTGGETYEVERKEVDGGKKIRK